MLVRIHKLYPDVELPKKADPGSSGFDLKSRENVTLLPKETHLFKMGFRLEIPKGLEAQIRSRSGLSLNHQVIVLNSPGTIDSSYTGEIGVIIHNSGNKPYSIQCEDRICQMVFCHVPEILFQETSTLSTTLRGDCGFGSTGK